MMRICHRAFFLSLMLAIWPNNRKWTSVRCLACALIALATLSATHAQQETKSPPEQTPPVRVGGLFYLSYQDFGGASTDLSKFVLKRGHIDVLADPLPHLFARLTTDAKHDADGEFGIRIKYAFGRFHTEQLGPVTEPFIEFGQVRLPWIYFEESIYRYRSQDGTFMDRLGLTSSADRGFTIGGLLGGKMPASYCEQVNPRIAGRRGSFAAGIYNGGGFTETEENDNKVWQARLTLRPMPELLPGLQVSGLRARGAGNTRAAPAWQLDAAMLSYETRWVVATAQRIKRVGNPRGSETDDSGRALEGEGWSLFVEAKVDPRWSLIARRDAFDPCLAQGRDSWQRWIAGLAYHLGKNNHILGDWERKTYAVSGRSAESRLQLTLQLGY